MSIRGIVFDIGGVLEITPDLGIIPKWEQKLQLQPGELNKRLGSVWEAGSIGAISEAEVHTNIGAIMNISADQVHALMDDTWREYLGTLNVELAAYFQSLRPIYQTALLSNSCVGAREREQKRYHFDELCDSIIYSHEVGISKPNQRIYALTCEWLGLQPTEVIFLDDSPAAVEAACTFGMHGILFKDTAQAIGNIQACIHQD